MKSLIPALLSVFVASNLHAQDGNFSLDKEYAMSAVGTIDLRSSDAEVTVVGSSRTTAHVKIVREVKHKGLMFGHENFTVDVSNENGNLRVHERSQSSHVGIVGYYHEKYTILIEAPLGVSLNVHGDDGDYRIENIAGSISLNIDDGDAELWHCTGDKFSFTLDDGTIRMDEGSGSLEVDADDGDIEIKKGAFTSIDISLDDADVTMETSLTDQGNYRIRGEDATIIINITAGGGEFDIYHDDGRVVTQGNFKVLSDEEDRTQVLLARGNAKVNVRADDGLVRLNAQ